MALASLALAGPLASQGFPPLRSVQELRIDGNAANLVPIVSMVIGPGGSIAVIQQQDRAIAFFDASGKSLGAVGREGQGPGEFEHITRIGWVGDTLWAHDGRRHRFTLFAPDKRVLRTIPVPEIVRPPARNPESLPEFRPLSALALYTDGSMLVSLGSASGPFADRMDSKLAIHARVRGDGQMLQIVDRYVAETKSHWLIRNGSRTAGGVFPFPIQPYYDVSPDGSRMALVTTTIVSDRAALLEVTALRATGDTIYVKRYPLAAQPIPRSVADSAIEAQFATWNARDRTISAEWRRLAYVPPIYPPVSRIVLGRDGTLWIRQRRTATGIPYLILAPTGEPVGTVTTPLRVEIIAVAGDLAWGLERDADDVESIVRYRVSRPPVR